MSTWYEKCMPRIKDIEPFITNLFKDVKNMNKVKGIYVWGSYARNYKHPNFRVKDLDIIARTKFNSEDLIAVGEKDIKNNITIQYLEEQGFDPEAVKFSKNFMSIKKFNIDHWAISEDRKLLHWGPILRSKEDSENINKEAEIYAKNMAGVKRSSLTKENEEVRKNWYQSYYSYINKYFEEMPSGWYKAEDIKIRELLSEAIKL